MELTPDMLPQWNAVECELMLCSDQAASLDPGTRFAALVLAQRAYVRAMAMEFQRPLDEVAHFYCQQLTELRNQATVLDYLPLLASKRLRSLYKRNECELQ